MDVQINVNDLMAAFAQENAALSQRAIIAEQRAKAYAVRVEDLEKQVTRMSEPAEAAPDPAVEAVAPTRRGGRKAPQ